MTSNDIKIMKEILSNDSVHHEFRQTTFTNLLSVALKLDDTKLFDWLQSRLLQAEARQKSKFTVKTILDAISHKSNNIILTVLRNFQKFEITNISQIKNANEQNIFHLSALSHNNGLIESILNAENSLELVDSIGIGINSLDICSNTIFHCAIKVENVEFINSMYNYLLPFNLPGTPQYSLGFQYFTDQILLHRNFSKQSVYDLLHKLGNISKFELLSSALASLSQLLFNLHYIRELRSYFSSEQPNKDISIVVYLELMAKISNNHTTAINEMKQILGSTYEKIMSDQYLAYVVRRGYRKTVACIINIDKEESKRFINTDDVCGLFWDNDTSRKYRSSLFLMWDAKVQEAAYCSFGKRSFWKDFFPTYKMDPTIIYNLEKFNHFSERSNIEMARWLFLYSKKFKVPDCNSFISSPTCDKIITKSFLSYRLWINNIVERVASRDVMPLITSFLYPDLETAETMLMKVVKQNIVISPPVSLIEKPNSNGMVAKSEYLTEWLVKEVHADVFLKDVSHLCGGQTALHLAIASNQILTIKSLIKFEPQLLFRESLSSNMLPINYAISLSSDDVDSKQDRSCMAMYIASAMADELAPYSTDEFAAVTKFTDSLGRSVESFAVACNSVKIKVLCHNNNNNIRASVADNQRMDEFRNTQLMMSQQTHAYSILCDKIISNQLLQVIVKECMDNGWMYFFQKANKLEEMGSVAEHQFLLQAVVAQRCDILDWYCSNVEGLLFPWLWRFNKDISLLLPGLLHTIIYSEETTMVDTATTNLLNKHMCSLRDLATTLELDDIIIWMDNCKASERVEEYQSKKWFETTLVTYEGYSLSNIGFRGALHSGASVQELSSLFFQGNQAVVAHLNSLKYESNRLKFQMMLSGGILVKEKYTSYYATILVADVKNLYSWPDKNEIYSQALLKGSAHVIDWLINLIPENYSQLSIMIPTLELMAISINKLNIVKILRVSKHKKYCHSVTNILQKAAAHSEFDIFYYFYESIELESERRPSTDNILSFLLNKNKISYYYHLRDDIGKSRKQQNSVSILKYIISKSNIWPDACSKEIQRIFSDHKSDQVVVGFHDIPVPLELCMFLMEEMGFELCQILSMELLEDFSPLLRLYKKSMYEVKVADMIISGVTVTELVAFTELHVIRPEAIRGGKGIPMTHLAAQYNHSHILEWLLQKGCDVYATDRIGRNIYEIAKLFNSYDILKILHSKTPTILVTSLGNSSIDILSQVCSDKLLTQMIVQEDMNRKLNVFMNTPLSASLGSHPFSLESRPPLLENSLCQTHNPTTATTTTADNSYYQQTSNMNGTQSRIPQKNNYPKNNFNNVPLPQTSSNSQDNIYTSSIHLERPNTLPNNQSIQASIIPPASFLPIPIDESYLNNDSEFSISTSRKRLLNPMPIDDVSNLSRIKFARILDSEERMPARLETVPVAEKMIPAPKREVSNSSYLGCQLSGFNGSADMILGDYSEVENLFCYDFFGDFSDDSEGKMPAKSETVPVAELWIPAPIREDSNRSYLEYMWNGFNGFHGSLDRIVGDDSKEEEDIFGFESLWDFSDEE